jgi:hypothetical protein
MFRAPASSIAALAFAISFALAPVARAAPLRTSLAYALTEDAPAGGHFWCVFRIRPADIISYERYMRGTWSLPLN